MTVGELIERLQNLDKEKSVKFEFVYPGCGEVYFGYSGKVQKIFESYDNVTIVSNID